MPSHRYFKSRAVLLLILSIAISQTTRAGIRPSFMLDESSWTATEIVMALSTSQDGVFQVAESWKGDLPPGTQVTVPELAPPPRAEPIAAYPKVLALFGNDDGPSVQIPRQPKGSRIVLFLRRKGDSVSPGDWAPASPFEDFKASAVWLDDGEAYAFQQFVNPGPSTLAPLDISEAKLRSGVDEVMRVQEDFEALQHEPGETRALHLRSYVHSHVPQAKRLALEELGSTGPAAVATIRDTLNDDTFASEADELIKAYAIAGGEAVGEDLNTRLRDELGFWQSAGPSLQPEWWNAEQTPRRESLRARYMQTLALALALQGLHYAEAASTARDLSNFWKSLPQLNDRGSIDQLAKECDNLIKHLSTTNRR